MLRQTANGCSVQPARSWVVLACSPEAPFTMRPGSSVCQACKHHILWLVFRSVARCGAVHYCGKSAVRRTVVCANAECRRHDARWVRIRMLVGEASAASSRGSRLRPEHSGREGSFDRLPWVQRQGGQDRLFVFPQSAGRTRLPPKTASQVPRHAAPIPSKFCGNLTTDHPTGLHTAGTYTSLSWECVRIYRPAS